MTTPYQGHGLVDTQCSVAMFLPFVNTKAVLWDSSSDPLLSACLGDLADLICGLTVAIFQNVK